MGGEKRQYFHIKDVELSRLNLLKHFVANTINNHAKSARKSIKFRGKSRSICAILVPKTNELKFV